MSETAKEKVYSEAEIAERLENGTAEMALRKRLDPAQIQDP